MRLSLIVCLVFVCHALPANGQEPQTYQATTPPPSARFEIFQAEHPQRSTLRLDRVTGRVHVLIQTPYREYTWQEMEVTERPESISGGLRFQLFTSSYRRTKYVAPRCRHREHLGTQLHREEKHLRPSHPRVDANQVTVLAQGIEPTLADASLSAKSCRPAR